MSHFMHRAVVAGAVIALLASTAATVTAQVAFTIAGTGQLPGGWKTNMALGGGVSGFDLALAGTYTCNTSNPAASHCTSAQAVITIHVTDNTNNQATGTQVASKTVGLAGGGSDWNTTFAFRDPVDSQFAIPDDGVYDVKGVFTILSGGGTNSITVYKDNYFGVDNGLPTSAILTNTGSSLPEATGTATDPGAAGAFSGFSNNQNPKPVRVQIVTDPGGVLVAGSEQFLELANLGASKQTGDWEYAYEGDPLSAGDYCLTSRATDLAGNVQDPVTQSCFTVDSPGEPDTVVVTTEVRDQNGSSIFPFDLGAIVHDIVTILTTGGSDIPGGSSVDFEFYTGGSCGTLSGSLSGPVENVGLGPDPLSSPVSASSSARGPLHAGDYSYKVYFTSGLSSAVSDGEADCEPFSVAMGSTTTVTTVHDAAHTPVANLLGGPVHDQATVDVGDDVYDGFDLDGTVTFTLYDNASCGGIGTPEGVAISGPPPQSVESSAAALAPGSYSYRAEYSGNADHSGSAGDCEPFTIAGLYLHNNPTPPTGNTNAQANLPLDGTAPTATTLYNYALNLDSNTGVTGRFIDKAPSGEELTTTDLQKYQTWRTAALASDLVINGDIDLTIWAKMKAPNKNIDLRAFLLECTSTTQSSCTLFATGDMPTLFNASSTSFQQLTVSFANVARTIDTGNRLQLRVVMLDISNADPAYLAYDTTTYPARLASAV